MPGPTIFVATLLHLLVPDLLQQPDGTDPALFRSTTPALEWLLARADAGPVPTTLDEVLFELFGLPAPIDADLPVAAFTRLADAGKIGDGDWWLRADPVHLRADMHGGVFLADARTLAIELKYRVDAQSVLKPDAHRRVVSFRQYGFQVLQGS